MKMTRITTCKMQVILILGLLTVISTSEIEKTNTSTRDGILSESSTPMNISLITENVKTDSLLSYNDSDQVEEIQYNITAQNDSSLNKSLNTDEFQTAVVTYRDDQSNEMLQNNSFKNANETFSKKLSTSEEISLPPSVSENGTHQQEDQTGASSKSSTRRRSLNSTLTTTTQEDLATLETRFYPSTELKTEALVREDGPLASSEKIITHHILSTAISNESSEYMHSSLIVETTRVSLIEPTSSEFVGNVHNQPLPEGLYSELERDDVSTLEPDKYRGLKPEVGNYHREHEENITERESLDMMADSMLSNREHEKYTDLESKGVTFDPDGMTHTGPQEPDSIVFANPKSEFHTQETNVVNITLETEIELLKDIENVMNPEVPVRKTEEFERLQHRNFTNSDREFNEMTGIGSTEEPSMNKISKEEVTNGHIEKNEREYEMMQDSPHILPEEGPELTQTTTNDKPSTRTISKSTSSLKPIDPETLPSTATVSVEESYSHFVIPHHQTEQSVLRPVVVQRPQAFSTTEPPPNPSTLHSNSIEVAMTDTTSPSAIIVPNPAPFTTENVSPEVELASSTAPEVIYSYSNGTNSTRVSIHLSISVPSLNDSISIHEKTELKPNSSFTTESKSLTEQIQNNATTLTETSESTSQTPINIQTTTGVKIRKPKIKIPGRSNPNEESTSRKPFTPSLKRQTTTAGPPVSIFKKSRTRIASITSSTTARPPGQYSTIRIHYASRIPEAEIVFPAAPLTTTTTTPAPTTTEEPFFEEDFTDPTVIPTIAPFDVVTLIKVAGYLVVDRGLRWDDRLANRHSSEYKSRAHFMQTQLERLFRSSTIAERLWKIEIDGFSGSKTSRPVAVDFFLYIIKSGENISTDRLSAVVLERLSPNNTFSAIRILPMRTAFERVQEEPLVKTTPPPGVFEEPEPPVPQWAIAVVVIGAASLIFIALFAAVTVYGRHQMRRRYSSKLDEEEYGERNSGAEWESKMAAAYENMAADAVYDAEEMPPGAYKKSEQKSRISTFHGIPATLKRGDSWYSSGWGTPPQRKRSHVP